MKKLLAILLALAMVMSLAACGSESKDEDKDEKKTEAADTVDKEDKEDKGDKEDKDDKDDKDDKEDAPVVNKGYTEALDVFVDVMTGDLVRMKDFFPSETWDLFLLGVATQLGYTPTTEEAIDLLFGDALSEEDFYDSIEYTIASETAVSDEDMEDIQTALADLYVTSDVEEAYTLEVVWNTVLGDEEEEEESTVVVAFVDGQWLLLSENYELYVTDM